MKTTSFIDIIPQEILVPILHQCDYLTIIRFSLTCKKAQQLVSLSVSLQLHIELEINGLEISNGSSKGNPNHSSVLKELKCYQDDILILDWDLRSGVYHGESRTSEIDSDSDRFQVNILQIAVLGSLNIPPPTEFGKICNTCVADPIQDLAILIEDEQVGFHSVRFHFRSITTGKPHLQIEHPILTVGFDNAFIQQNDLSSGVISVIAEVVGDCFVAKFYWAESVCTTRETLLWERKTGTLLARTDVESDTDRSIFIDKEHLLVCSSLPENDLQSARISLNIYHIPNVVAGHKLLPNAKLCPSLYPKHNPILVFELPELHPSWTISQENFELHSDPLPGDVVYSKSVSFLCSRVTTLTLGFRIWCISSQGLRTYYYFHVFINTQNIFAHIREFRSEETVTIPWNGWGPSATRWFVGDHITQRSTYGIYRSQYLQSIVINESRDDTELVSVIDFNTPTIKRYAYNSGTTSKTTEQESTDITERTLVLEGKGMIAGRRFQPGIDLAEVPIATVGQALDHQIFAETVGSDMKTIIRDGFKYPVASCLPYRVVTKLQRMPMHYRWRIHGEYLVGAPWSDLLQENPPFSLYKLELPSQF
ncbi:unnamed protein product [Rhizoctonia solani]|uniref:F-box domain-containing protein n=1 Tax=Rhizoctonia solani TaxID=456999 RepID=A0A8H3HPW5_9AGAM|nr:unnamed protein product [Rhizoctonia solani]